MKTSDINDLPASRASYLLICRLDAPLSITVGRLGTFDFKAGTYAYCGSAFGPGGLKSRAGRHAKKKKKHHWHIDYLSARATLIEIFYSTQDKKLECDWAKKLMAGDTEIPACGFGSSDCTCSSHLFYLHRRNILIDLFSSCEYQIIRPLDH